MKLCCTSDLHGHLPEIPDCDLLLLGGDYAPVHAPVPEYESQWIHTMFWPWLLELQDRKIPVIGIAGNHDLIFETKPTFPESLPWTYLCDSAVRQRGMAGLCIYGTPWQPPFFDWAFNLPEEQLAKKWALIPEDIDILLLHGPPHGYGDLSHYGNTHTGSPSLTQRILEVRPKLVVCGHIHEAYGEYSIDGIRCLNVSHMDRRYRPVNPVVEVEL